MLPSERYRRPEAGAVLTALHEISAQHGYLPEAEVRRAAEVLGVPASQMFGAATFYAAFSFAPRGRHTIHVCLGTACYIRGGQKMLDKLQSALNVAPGQTTADGAFTLQTVRCVGSCSMSPVIRVDDRIYGRLKADTIPRLLRQFQSQS